MMNLTILMGRLTADPTMYRTAEGTACARYTLAVDRRTNGDEKTDFIRCIVWDKKAEFAEKYLHTGMKILVTGRIQTGSYKDKDGKTVYTTDVVVFEQEFCERKQPATEKKDDGFVPVGNEEDLPFN